MKKALSSFLFSIILLCSAQSSFAWGKTGHSIVAEIAFQYLDDSLKNAVQKYLGSMSIEDAASWMDANRSNHDFDYMKPWHYIDISKGQVYQSCSDSANLINELKRVMLELSHKNSIPEDEIQRDVLILFHLIGDMHQPLHVGYPEDKGGNSIKLTFLSLPSNLHHVWDDGIIDEEHITAASCIALYGNAFSKDQLDSFKKVDIIEWMNQTRLLLDTVYDFTNDNIDITYCQRNGPRIEKQLFLAGIRLAALLEMYFKNNTPVTTVIKDETVFSKGTISPADAINHVGEKVTVCGKVYGGKFLANSNGTPTLINIGAPFPNSPFTVVIFGDDRSKFSYKPEEFLNNKEICVTGTIKEFHGKAEIVVSKESQIEIK